MFKPVIAIIILNYNNAKDTIRCLSSLNTISNGHHILPILVDNGSSDGSLEEITKLFSKISLIKSDTNLGFAGGNNLGIKYALKRGADYIFLVNNDIRFVHRQTLTNLLKTNLDITSPLVRYSQNKKVFYDFGGRVDHWFGRNTHLRLSKTPSITPSVDYLSGVSLFIKSKVFKKTGLLDDKYFLYYEDVDFCLRALRKGFSLGMCPNTFIDHKLSSSSNKLGRKKIWILAQSHLRFSLRHLPPLSWPSAFLFNLYLRLKFILNR